MLSCMLSSTLKEKLLAAMEIISSAGEAEGQRMLTVTVSCCTVMWSVLHINVMIAMMVRMTMT